MNTIEDVTLRVVDASNACGSPYMLVGSFSSNLYGIPRSTKDADFVLQLQGDLSPVFFQTLVQASWFTRQNGRNPQSCSGDLMP